MTRMCAGSLISTHVAFRGGVMAVPVLGARSTHSFQLVDRSKLSDPGYQAFLVLRTAFTVAPILFGLDKFANLMTFWPK